MIRSSIIVSSAVLIVVSLRIVSLASNTTITPIQLPELTADVIDSPSARDKFGITGVEYQRFDPLAVFAVRPGPDQKPGVADTDDNMDGVTDDRMELGATRSDDLCLVLGFDQQQDMDGDMMVLQQGALVPVRDSTQKARSERAIVYGESADGSPWSLLVELDREKG